MIEVNDSSFYFEVIEKSHELPVLVDFWAPWCQPCRIIGPVLEKLEKEYGGKFLLVKINVQENQEVASHYNVKSIPAVKIFLSGNPVDEFVGALPESEIRKFLGKTVESETDSIMKEGKELFGSGQLDEAADKILQVLKNDPANEKASLTLADIYIQQQELEKAKEILEKIEYDEKAQRLMNIIYFKEKPSLSREQLDSPADIDALIALGDHYAKKEEYHRAMDEYLKAVKKNKEYKDGRARKAVLKIFTILGNDDPAVAEYRNKLSDILF